MTPDEQLVLCAYVDMLIHSNIMPMLYHATAGVHPLQLFHGLGKCLNLSF